MEGSTSKKEAKGTCRCSRSGRRGSESGRRREPPTARRPQRGGGGGAVESANRRLGKYNGGVEVLPRGRIGEGLTREQSAAEMAGLAGAEEEGEGRLSGGWSLQLTEGKVSSRDGARRDAAGGEWGMLDGLTSRWMMGGRRRASRPFVRCDSSLSVNSSHPSSRAGGRGEASGAGMTGRWREEAAPRGEEKGRWRVGRRRGGGARGGGEEGHAGMLLRGEATLSSMLERPRHGQPASQAILDLR